MLDWMKNDRFAALLLITLKPRDPTVEISIPVANLIEDEAIANIAVAGLVNSSLVEEMARMEEFLSFDNDEAIAEMSREERKTLVNFLNRKYTTGT